MDETSPPGVAGQSQGSDERAGGPPSKGWMADFLASLVVFLVALPLCIGIAVACGVPAERGLISGIVGGLVVGVFAGAPLLVTGPAASLIVPVFDLVEKHGLAALGPVVILAGGWQIVAGLLGLGQWFRAVAPAVIIGMLVGIGLLIFASQLHVAVDSDPSSSLVENILRFPGAVWSHLSGSYSGLSAMAVGVLTIVLLVAWNRFRPRRLRLVPGHLVSLITVSLAVFVFDLPVRFLDVSPDFLAALAPVHTVDLQSLLQPSLLGKSLIFAFVASAATLLTASAIDQRQNHSQANYNREMVAQGIGNVVTGGLGGLPMTGVIVRSSVNVDAGAHTRASAILHGVWILAFVLVMPEVLERIPRSALGAILVYTGYKLIDLQALKALYQRGKSEFSIALVTLIGVVFVELFVGVLAGLAAAIFKLVYTFSHLQIRGETSPTENTQHLHLSGAATFVRLPQLAEALEALPEEQRIVVHIDHLDHIDHACLELLSSFKQRREAKSQGEVVVEWDELTHRYHQPVLGVGLRSTGNEQSLLSMVWAEWKRAYGFWPDKRAPFSETGSFFESSRLAVKKPYQSLQDVVEDAAAMIAPELGCQESELSSRLLKRADRHIVLGEGISIPHAPLSTVQRPVLACLVAERPVGLFGEHADIFFVLIAPESDPEQHLQALAHIGGLCHDTELLTGLRQAVSKDDALLLLRQAEQRSDRVEGSGRRERRLAVLEMSSREEALRVRELLLAAFQVDVTIGDSGSELFETLRPLLGISSERTLLIQSLKISDVVVLRTLLAEQERLFPDLLCRLHLLQTEVDRAPSARRAERTG